MIVNICATNSEANYKIYATKQKDIDPNKIIVGGFNILPLLTDHRDKYSTMKYQS